MDISTISSALQAASVNNTSNMKTSIVQPTGETQTDLFGALLNSSIENLSQTNSYISDANAEQIKLAMGETDNTHDLTVALQKASTALQYTVAVRDNFLTAYKEIMNMQI